MNQAMDAFRSKKTFTVHSMQLINKAYHNSYG